MKTIIVPVSGGKDSQVVLSLALAARRPRQRLVCVHQNTGWDHPLTYQQIKRMEAFYGVQVEHTHSDFVDGDERGMMPFLRESQYFPNAAARGCTQKLKQLPFANWLVEKGCGPANCEIWFGMRADESRARNDKYGESSGALECTLGDVSDFYKKRDDLGLIPCHLPIVDWTAEEVFAHIKAEGAPLNPLYAKGHTRVGCYPCLLARKSEWEAAAKDPVGRVHLQDMIDLEDAWAKPGGNISIAGSRKGQPRKYIKVHRVWDVRKFLDADGAKELAELSEAECGWCSI